MQQFDLGDLVEGVRCVPRDHQGVGALVLAGSSGRVDAPRARVVAAEGVLAESIRWFGGPGQHDGPWEIPVELFLSRVELLRQECDRIVVIGTSFGAEAALLTGTLSGQVDAVVGFAPTDVVWAGVTSDGRMTSHWTYRGDPLPSVPFITDWQSDTEPPAFVNLYRASRAHFHREAVSAEIPVERIREVLLVAGGDDRVWPSFDQAVRIRDRRTAHGKHTTLVTDAEAGHRPILPGEPQVAEGMSMQRGGSQAADRRLGSAAWPHVVAALRPSARDAP